MATPLRIAKALLRTGAWIWPNLRLLARTIQLDRSITHWQRSDASPSGTELEELYEREHLAENIARLFPGFDQLTADWYVGATNQHKTERQSSADWERRFASALLHTSFRDRNTLDFEAIVHVLSSGNANRDISRMTLRESSSLYSLARGRSSLFEVGRRFGGSTIILAGAKSPNGTLVSVDIDPVDDERLASILTTLGVEHNVELVKSSIERYSPVGCFDFAFVDGDHSYEAVKRDFLCVYRHTEPSGVIAFHDMGAENQYVPYWPGPSRLLEELKQNPGVEYLGTWDSLSAFRRLRKRTDSDHRLDIDRMWAMGDDDNRMIE